MATLVAVAPCAPVLAIAIVGAQPRLTGMPARCRIDHHSDGLMLSAIHARGEPPTCATGIVEGDGDVTLTPDEQQALAAAPTGKGSR